MTKIYIKWPCISFFEHKQYGKDYAAEKMLECLYNEGITKTLDGTKYSKTSIRAAMVGM